MDLLHPGVHDGSRVAYRMQTSGETVLYSELNDCANQGAQLFRNQGLIPGDGIAILLPNHVETLKITWAAQRSGLYYTPISILFQSSEIEYILQNSDAKILITQKEQLDKFDPSKLENLTIFLVDEAAGDYACWQDCRDQYPIAPIQNEFEGAEMIYSSGTTGRPKGVRFPLSHAPLGTVSELYKTRVKLHQVDDSTRYLSTAPMYHSAPLRYNMMVTRQGGTAFILEKFDPETALEMIKEHKITHSQWVPTMFVRLLKLPKEIRQRADVSSLKFAIHAAAPCPIDIKQQMIDWFGPILYEYYSGTEANGSTAITSKEWLSHRGSVGRAIHGKLHILDDKGQELPHHSIGDVYFSEGSAFSYYKDPEKTRLAHNDEGWSTLGDIGYVDEEGYLYLKDRRSFMIISGGVNIYPQETENSLINHPKVADVAVFGVPNREFGEEVKAVVELLQPDDANDLLARELIDFCRADISHLKCPKSIDFVTSLPRHPTGKLYKRKLRDSYWVDA